MKLSRSELHKIYYFLRLTRRTEDQLTSLYRQGKVVGGVYSGLGQEAISVGTSLALERGDFVGPMIRNVGTLLVRGYRPRDLFLQYMARRDGPTGGRDANTHFGDLARGVIAPISMLGELVPVLAGIGLAAKMRKERRVALTYIGDGASSTTPCHEGMNFAVVQRLPLLIVAESNGWAYSTPVSKQMAIGSLADRAKAYGMASVKVDGNDVLAVYAATRAAGEIARQGRGPTLIECITMRMKGHAEHDDARYVPREMLEAWRKKDPIARFEKFLARTKQMTSGEKGAIEERMEKEIREDVEFAESSPLPAPEAAARPVWA